MTCPCAPCRIHRRLCRAWCGVVMVAGIVVYAVPMAVLLALGYPRRKR